MLDVIEALIRNNKTCVLATSADNKPHCSLMAYTVNETCREMYLITHRTTRKYKNLQKNPHVSLLVDTRATSDDSVCALTIEGVYSKIEDSVKRNRVGDQFLSAHPRMQSFIENGDTDWMCIRITSFLLLNNLTEAHFFKIS